MSKKDGNSHKSNQQKMSRNDRFAQMSHQEKIIEQKKREILAKLEAKKTSSENAQTEEDTKVVNQEEKKPTLNVFNNDGSFLSTFKSLKDRRLDSKLKSFKSKDHGDSIFSKWNQKPPSSPKDRNNKQNRIGRMPEKNYAFEQQKITINTSFQQNFDYSSVQQQLTIPEPQLQNIEIKEKVLTTEIPLQVQLPQNEFQVIVSQPVLFSVPQTAQIPTHNLIVSTADPINLQIDNQIVNVPTVELASIPAPNPIQVQNIPQPAPLNALNIPQPAPLQLQNIPQPAPLQLNEIPNPKPLDLMKIPTPGDDGVDATFLKNVPPPNKTVPPPVAMNVPPPPPPQQQTAPTTHNVLVNATFAPVISIPALMAQPILPPSSILGAVNVSCPPPLLTAQAPPPPPFVTQLPPMSVPPPIGMPMVNGPPPIMPLNCPDLNTGTPEYESMASLARMVAQCGPGIQDVVQQRKKQDPSLWFLFHKESAVYGQYQRLIEQFQAEIKATETTEYKPEDVYEPEVPLEEEDATKTTEFQESSESSRQNRRKRKSRWGNKDPGVSSVPATVEIALAPSMAQQSPVMLSKITRTDPALLQYARQTFGSVNLTEEEWKKAEDHYKINLLYQDMVKKREEVERLKMAGKNKYDYDSDEETDGGTWEHKLREKEMTATQLWADELTRQAEGKHHIGDFLPPEEFKRFMEKSSAAKEGKQLNFSDYKEFKIKEDNIGYKMLQKLGWTEGTGLGSEGSGIVDPVNKAATRDTNQGLGLTQEDYNDDDEYESYRKRMMLAYRFRPNPLNNPRRPYY